MAITAFLSRSPGLLNRGPGGSASLRLGPHSSISSPTATAQSGTQGPLLLGAGSLYRILSLTNLNFLSLGSYNNLTPTLLPAIVTISHSIQPLDSQGYILIFLDRMYLLFTQCIFYFDSLAGSAVNIHVWYGLMKNDPFRDTRRAGSFKNSESTPHFVSIICLHIFLRVSETERKKYNNGSSYD